MAKKGEKFLTSAQVKELGLNNVSVITADMLEGFTRIEDNAFAYCTGLTSVTIPNSVTRILSYAFRDCTGLTSVTIPNSVTSIGEDAFYDCTSLASINVASDNSNYCSVDGVLFNKNKTTLIQCPGGKQGAYAIPDDIESIAGSAFEDCIRLTSVTIPNSVTSIGDWAFYGCIGLTSIVIPDSVTRIGYKSFYGCSGLTSITIPNSITIIELYAFAYCSGLTSVTIGDKTYEKQTVVASSSSFLNLFNNSKINSKCKAYKGFNADMTCRDFQYEEGKTHEYEGKPELCECGFHASLCLPDVFNYYCGELGKDVVVYEVELEGVTDERNGLDSKVVAKKITIGKRIL